MSVTAVDQVSCVPHSDFALHSLNVQFRKYALGALLDSRPVTSFHESAIV